MKKWLVLRCQHKPFLLAVKCGSYNNQKDKKHNNQCKVVTVSTMVSAVASAIVSTISVAHAFSPPDGTILLYACRENVYRRLH